MDTSKVRNLSLASAVAMALGIPLDSSAAGYLKMGDIKGESADADHKEWIDVLSWSWGMSEGDRGKTCVQDMTFEKEVDRATDDLAQSIPAATVFPSAELEITEVDVTTSGQSYLKTKYRMRNVRLTSLQSSGSNGGTGTESFSISFDEMEGTYWASDGSRPEVFIIPGNSCK
jgi:type VI secretion system secreted protein Hcp